MAPLVIDLDAPCGKHFRFRDLIQCGETWHRLDREARRVENLPLQEETLEAMVQLCAVVLDPVVDHFGPIELTYGFASPALTKYIPGRISPKHDQHASWELNRSGKLVCARRGMAVDLWAPSGDTRRVAVWLASHTKFDRLYFYGSERPVHVSVGPDSSNQVILLTPTPAGRRIPRVIDVAHLCEWR